MIILFNKSRPCSCGFVDACVSLRLDFQPNVLVFLVRMAFMIQVRCGEGNSTFSLEWVPFFKQRRCHLRSLSALRSIVM